MTTTAIINPPKTVSEKIRWARKRAGLSLDKLADAAGTSRQYLIQLEHGRNKPSVEMLTRIAEGTGQPVEFFIGGPQERLEQERQARLKAAFDPFWENLAESLMAIVREEIKDAK